MSAPSNGVGLRGEVVAGVGSMRGRDNANAPNNRRAYNFFDAFIGNNGFSVVVSDEDQLVGRLLAHWCFAMAVLETSIASFKAIDVS